MAELDRAGSAGGVFGQTNVVVDDEEEEDSDQVCIAYLPNGTRHAV